MYFTDEAEALTDNSRRRPDANRNVLPGIYWVRVCTFKYLWRAQGNCDLVGATPTNMLMEGI
jgi:hypothetical protein